MDIIYRNNPAKHQLDGILSSMILNQDLVQIKLHDVTTKKEPVSSGTSGNNSKNGEVNRPALHTDSSTIRIINLLQYVNDKDHPRLRGKDRK